MKRPTDEQLRRRVAKVKGLKLFRPFKDDKRWCYNAPHGAVAADWLESLDAAVGLLEELRTSGAIAVWEIGRADDGAVANISKEGGDWFQVIYDPKSLCRAACLAYLAVMEAKR